MRKLASVLLSLLMIASLFSGCSKQPASPSSSDGEEPTSETPAADTPVTEDPAQPAPTEKKTVRLGGLKGATTMGLAKLLSDAEAGLTGNDYTFQLAGAADVLTPLLLKGELDVIAVPLNLGAALYNNSEGGVRLLAVNTLGVLYIVEKGGESVTDISSLKGKTIYATGKGSTPEYALNYLLMQNGLDPSTDVSIEWKSEPTAIVAQMSTMDNAVAMLPQPYVAAAQSQIDGLRVALDLTEEWDALENGSSLLTAGLIVRTAFMDENPDAIDTLMKEYASSTEYVNTETADAATLIEQYGIVKAAIAEKALPSCNIVCITGEDMRTCVQGYFGVLFDQNPKSLGGSLPGDDFYVLQ